MTAAGRAHELERIQAALADVAEGRGRALAIVAEPGMGKTHLMNAASASARKQGLACAWGVGFEEGGAPAFAPVVHACRALAARTHNDALAQAAAALSSPTSAPSLDPDARRFLLFSDLAAALSSSPAPGVALLFDDAHAFDRGSLALLAFLARALRADPVLLAVAWRPSEQGRSVEIDEALGRLARELEVVRVGPLARDAVGELARAALGASCSAHDIDELARRSGGNALFVVEMLSRAKADPARRLPDAIPETVRGVIAGHVAVLAGTARAALEAAAIIGVEVHLSVVAALLDAPPEGALARLEESVRAGCLVDDGGLRLRFAHPLYRECVVEGLTPVRRRDLHAKAAAALVRVHDAAGTSPTQTSAHAIAHHLLGAGAAASLADVVRWTARAARDAMRVGVDEEAVALLVRALARCEGDAHDAGAACDVLTLLAEAHARAGAVAAGKESAVRAAALARRLVDPIRFAHAALAHGHEIMPAVIDPTLVALLDEALALLPAVDDAAGGGGAMLRARVEARLAAARQPHEDPNVPMRMARAAVARARAAAAVAPSVAQDEEGRDVALALVLHHAGSALVEFGPPSERAPLSEETLALARRLGDRSMALLNARRLVHDRVELGDFAGGDAALETCAELCKGGPLRHRTVAPLLRVMMAHARGRFDEVRALHADVAALLEGGVASPYPVALAMQRIAFARDSGTGDELVSTGQAIARLASLAPGGGSVARARMWGSLLRAASLTWLGDIEAARAAMVDLVLDGPIASFGGYGACVHAEVIEACGDVERARAQDALPLREWIVSGTAPLLDGLGARPRALLRSTLGHHDEAARLLAGAAATLEGLGLVVPALRTRFDEARVRVKAGDTARARAVLDDVRGTAERLPSPLLLARADALARTLAGAPAPSSAPSSAASSATSRVPAGGAPSNTGLVLERDGEVWRLSFAGRATSLKDSRGMAMLARLVAQPGVDVAALDLEGAGGGERVLDGAGVGPALDEEAKRLYRARLRALAADVDEAERAGDVGALARARAEQDALEGELSRAIGKGGRDRKIASAAERARVNVQRRIKDAVDRIRAADPAAGAYLESAVKTGASCSYRPGG